MVEDTIGYYDRNAARFAAATADLDMSPIYERFLPHIPKGGQILDAGCGIGRDAQAFADRGFRVMAFDASTAMVKLARERVGSLVEVRQMRFVDVAWQEEFDGIWTCASLLHVPSIAFRGVAARFISALRPGGVWYMSFKLGVGERIADGRHFLDHTEETLRVALDALVEFVELWISADIRTGRGRERWLNAIVVRPHPVGRQHRPAI